MKEAELNVAERLRDHNAVLLRQIHAHEQDRRNEVHAHELGNEEDDGGERTPASRRRGRAW